MVLPVGTLAPAFAANDHHGDIVRLGDLSGKWVAMWWYPKASTPG